MLLPNDLDYLARKEQHQDLIRQAERAQLIDQANQARQANPDTYRKLIGRIGSQMIDLGEKLEGYGTPPSHKTA